jgi:hypothetical protein
VFIQCVLSLLLLCHSRAGASAPLLLFQPSASASVQGVHLYFLRPVLLYVFWQHRGERQSGLQGAPETRFARLPSLSLSGLNVTPPGRVRLLVVI